MENNNEYSATIDSSIAVADPLKQETKVEENNVTIKEQSVIKVKGGKAYAFFKRAFDIVSSLLAIIVLSPLMLIIAILVKCTSRGPIIYTSTRIGKNGKPFKFYKFRSMYKDAEKRLQDLLDKNEVKGGVIFKMKDYPRITPFGKFIRKTSLDELPQLFNILNASMSVVGPRPCTDREWSLNCYTDYMKQRTLVKQGLTGEWQARGRSNTTFNEMIEMDLDYVQNKRSFWYDIKLILLTIPAVLHHKGAE